MTPCTLLVTHGGPHFAEALASLGAQTLPSRVIVIVDGPTDSDIDLPDDDGIDIVVLPKRIGTARAFAAGVQLVDEDVVFFLEDEHTFAPDHVASCVKTMSSLTRFNWVWAGRKYIGTGDEDRSVHGMGYVEVCGIAMLRKLAVLASPYIAGAVDENGKKMLTKSLSGAMHDWTKRFTLNWRREAANDA